MRCAWNELLKIVPQSIRQDVDRQGRDTLQELRLRLGMVPEMVTAKGPVRLSGIVTESDISFVVNTASRYSPWAAATAAKGYITAQGGHRIGICGEAVISGGSITGIRSPTSLCIRVARDFPGIAAKAAGLRGNTLILGPPGSGKTTLLRDLIRQISDSGIGSVAVVDERGELFPLGFPTGKRTDILSGCTKVQGVQMTLRTMGPAWIAVDEITAREDCEALTEAGWCGVRLLATAHASDRADLNRRPVYRPLLDCGLFENLIILHPDKSWRTERMVVCP